MQCRVPLTKLVGSLETTQSHDRERTNTSQLQKNNRETIPTEREYMLKKKKLLELADFG